MNAKFSRRSFLHKGVKSAAAATAAPYLLKSNIGSASAMKYLSKPRLAEYYDHFQVDQQIINRVMSEALSRGGHYCDIFFQHRIENSLGLEDNAVNRAYSNVDYGVGIRVLKDDQTGYCFTEEITPEAMKQAAKTAANIADSNTKVKPAELKLHDIADHYPIETRWDKVPIDKKIPYLQKMNEKVFATDNRIIKVKVFFADQTSSILIATSDGRIACDNQPMATIFVNCTAEHQGRREQNYSYISGRHGIEYFNKERIDFMVNQAVKRTVDLFEAVKIEGGEMPVVLAPGSSGILLHEAIGHGMEADFNRKNISIYSDMVGRPVAEKFVSIVDDGTLKGYRGSINIDDEANDTEKTYLVKDGILETYLHDRISAKHYNVTPTGNGRRESFRFVPMPRMRNTYMLPGPHKNEEIIKSIKKGLYAEQFTNGEVYIGGGDFTFYLKSGRLIENGKITSPVKDVNIIGDGPDVLKNIVMVADDLKIEQGGGTCGKDGQRAPVSFGLPTVKVSKITVGGV
ncbi:MAG: TldD/PmbA family protein [Planctomycetota bacterium]|jgi:TldD protein